MGVYLNCECSVGSDGTIDFCDVHGAAPDMLDALQDIVKQAQRTQMMIRLDPRVRARRHRQGYRGQAVIAKATGGKP